MEDVSIDMGKEMSSEHRSSSDGTASPKRQMMSPLHMKGGCGLTDRVQQLEYQ